MSVRVELASKDWNGMKDAQWIVEMLNDSMAIRPGLAAKDIGAQ